MSNTRDFFLALLILSFIFSIYGFILISGRKALTSLVAQCVFQDNVIRYGGRTAVSCYAKYKPTTYGETFSILLPLPSATNIKSAIVQFINVITPYVEVNINGSLPPDTKTYESIEIPSDAYNIAIYGEIIGKGVDTDYPDYPYIHGGNYPLDCGPDCKYNKGLIVDRPGTYTLEIYSGTTGAGIDYIISGGYYLPYPSVDVYVDDTLVKHIAQLSTFTTIDISNYIKRTPSTLTIKTIGYPNYEVIVSVEQDCAFTGTDFTCKYLAPEEIEGTLVICTAQSNVTCNVPEGVSLFIGLADLPHISDATNISITFGTKTYYTTPDKPYVYISGPITMGEYTITVQYTLPYLLPGAVKAAGTCVADKDKIYLVVTPGSTANTTLTVLNFGTKSILANVRIGDVIQPYVKVYPMQTILEPNKPTIFSISVSIPEGITFDKIRGEIVIEGCGPTGLVIPVEIVTSEKQKLFLQTIIIVGTAGFILIILWYVYKLLSKRFI